jgi:SSS family solute:Na+ symporter
MFATNVDNADLVGVTGETYRNGLHIISVYALGSAAGGILAAFFLTPAIYRAGFYTNAEYLEARFGPVARAVSALIQIQYRSSMLGMMIWSAHLLLTRLVGLSDLMAWIMIVVLVILAGMYTAWGGLRSVVWTDTAQGIVMMVASIVIFVAVWQAVDGWSGMTQALQNSGREDMVHIGRYQGGDEDHPISPWVVVLAWTIVGCGYWTVNHTQTMRLMGARSIWDMKMAAIWGVAISFPIMVVSATLGVFARAIPALSNIADDQVDTIYPALASQFLVPGLKGIVVAGVLAAVVSTFDSMGSALSAIFTRDIYARFLVRDRDDRHYLRVGRIATVGVLALGFLYLPFIWKQEGIIKAFTTLIPVFVTPLFTVYMLGVLTRVHRRSGIVGLLVGSAYGVLALVDREFYDMPSLPFWLTSKWPAFCWSLLITTITMAVTTLVLGRDKGDTTTWSEDKGWLRRSREELPKLIEHPFAGEVPAYLQPRWAAALLMIAAGYATFVLFW